MAKNIKYVCIVCEYVYNPRRGDVDNGVDPNTTFEDLPDDWVCPKCGEGKMAFEEYKWNHLNLD